MRPVGTAPNISGIAHQPGVDPEVAAGEEFVELRHADDEHERGSDLGEPGRAEPGDVENDPEREQRKAKRRARRHRDVAGAHAREQRQPGDPADKSERGEKERERGAGERDLTKPLW